MKITRRKFIIYFFSVTAFLAIVRLLFPSVSTNKTTRKDPPTEAVFPNSSRENEAAAPLPVYGQDMKTVFKTKDGKEVKSRIYSVPGFEISFPDQNDVQLLAAQKWGVEPVADSADASKRLSSLVYIGSNPYFYIDHLHDSSPFLVPRAAVLLQDIGRNFFDSLQVKRIPLHKIIVTSVLRTKADVAKLQKKNANAKSNSCHLFGTTFDVAYNRYKTVEAPGEHRREVRNDTLKWVLAEVMRDMRRQNRCFVKYEVNQGCWHITVK
ncbi:hypothetical protein PRBRB14_23630 [Hallella multisaccharivorax DSM 17128]|uniref:Uncharacterized protein n=1 Tax=Hallella multisaccharivorax DSM 17128 TaxID=688246 RepID=F8N6H4_9BACT|nr:DUF5715 family protein [Hallella multisaccharivorax]EGN57279.1 hypothetical protein Premu_1875 [Hallella multisaccharivorax DSM 17128]GJG31484.1 hypothetical protein PRBRB14_23630 [Hallella multisaccharivorax DSM 17128]